MASSRLRAAAGPSASVASTGTTSTDSSTWIGIDGWSNSSVIQAGTEQGWNASSHSAYYDAWWEILPAAETVSFTVSPGDNIGASIRHLSGNQWSIYLLDRNNDHSISQTSTYNGPRTSAEFIQEAPTGSSCPGWTKLDNNPRAVAITVSNGS